MPVIRAKPEDVVELDPPNTGAWLDAAVTSSFMDEDGKGRTYAQMHASLGGWCCPADVRASRAVVAHRGRHAGAGAGRPGSRDWRRLPCVCVVGYKVPPPLSCATRAVQCSPSAVLGEDDDSNTTCDL